MKFHVELREFSLNGNIIEKNIKINFTYFQAEIHETLMEFF